MIEGVSCASEEVSTPNPLATNPIPCVVHGHKGGPASTLTSQNSLSDDDADLVLVLALQFMFLVL